ncbi:amidohydrolase family protein [Mycolicibacterium hodleri]|uniref:Amidohydrolase n=1 Tax=Mycolicibacterium hodleri TaxID=49897 RepID=A0A502EIH7_9MYCO|nr:amidohydrolase family protein [Mycolicibacterium hodleri]TPG36849.1 amidohydrolase [Mycolicibacterium hodleri]
MTTQATNVALEEHFIIPSFLDYLSRGIPQVPPEVRTTLIRRLSDFGEERLSEMDRGGVRMAVLSISGPGVQIEPDAATATRLAAEANDALVEVVANQPDRYAGFAHLAMQDPGAAADELERCVGLGFRGAMINDHTNGVYLDDTRHDVFWERLQDLDVPLYLHPGDSFQLPYVFDGVPELAKPTWEWTTETATHALRLIVTGVFDRFPRAQVILGHMGETLPYMLWRLDSRYRFTSTDRRVQRNPSDYLKDNFSVTTSGQCDDVPLQAALAALGERRVMFSVDYPYESSEVAGRFMDTAAIYEETRGLVGHRNAEALLKLKS